MRRQPNGSWQCTCDDPHCTNVAKHPATGRGHLDATLDHTQVDRWFDAADAAGYPANIGIAVPDGMVVLDVDPRNGGIETLQTLERQHGIPETATVITGGGGVHLWYRMPPGLRFALPPELRKKGIDVKQQGGYVVAPPSLHESERLYAWRPGSTGTVKPPVDAPAWIVGMSRPVVEVEARKISTADVDAPTQPAHVIDYCAQLLNQYASNVRHGHHDLCKNFGGWAKQRGWSMGDVHAILSRVDLKNHEGGYRAALSAWGIDTPFGWQELSAQLGPAVASQLDRAPNPVAEARAASLATLERGVPAAPPPAQPGQYQPPPAQQYAAAPPPAGGGLGTPIDLSQPIPEDIAAIEGLPIHTGQVNAIVGYAGDGKTPLLCDLAVHLANGRTYHGRETRRGRVLYLCFEAARSTARILQRFAQAYSLPLDGVEILDVNPGRLAEFGYVQRLRDTATAGYQYVVIDTYGSAITGVDQNDATFADCIKQLEIPNVATLVSIHTSKQSGTPDLKSIAGTGALAGAIKGAIGVSRPDQEDEHRFTINCVRAPDQRFRSFDVRYVDVPAPGESLADQLRRPGIRSELISDDEPVAGLSEQIGERRRPSPRQNTGKFKTQGDREAFAYQEVGNLISRWAQSELAADPRGASIKQIQVAVCMPDNNRDFRAVREAVRRHADEGTLVSDRGGRNGAAKVWRPPHPNDPGMINTAHLTAFHQRTQTHDQQLLQTDVPIPPPLPRTDQRQHTTTTDGQASG